MDLLRTLRRIFIPYRDTREVVEENRRSTERVIEKVEELQRQYERGSVYHDIAAIAKAVDRTRPPPPSPSSGVSRR